jgi:sugar phosphate isomerase/epimerase
MILRKSLNVTSGRCLNVNVLKMLRSCGFDGVDLNFSGDFFEEDQLERICDNLNAAGLVCAQVHLPTYGLFVDCGEDDPELERKIEFALSVMPTLGAKWGAIHVRSAAKRGFDRDKAMQDNIRWLKRLVSVAETYGVGIAVENLPTFPGSPGCAILFVLYRGSVRTDRCCWPSAGVCLLGFWTRPFKHPA